MLLIFLSIPDIAVFRLILESASFRLLLLVPAEVRARRKGFASFSAIVDTFQVVYDCEIVAGKSKLSATRKGIPLGNSS